MPRPSACCRSVAGGVCPQPRKASGGADGHVLDDLDLIDVLGDIPTDSAAAVILIEHRWSASLREAIVEANGVPIIDMWVHPPDLVAIGASEAELADD